MGEFWSIERESGNVTVLVLDRHDLEVNTLSESVLRELNQVLDGLAGEPQIGGIVFTSGKRDFIVGADIKDIARLNTVETATAGSRQMQQILQKIADFPATTVAAIHGQALGGGLELAMACTFRLATSDAKTKLGLPEIQLGLIPGAGGTQRLPRLVGLQTALDLVLTGRRLSGKKAEKAGLVDACVPEGQLREEAIRFAQRSKPSHRRTRPDIHVGKLTSDLPRWATEGNPIGRKVMRAKAKEMVDSKTKGFYPASYRALDAIFDGFDLPLAKGLELEANLFGQLAVTRESQSLIHLFHATTGLKKHPFKAAGKERFGTSRVKSIGLIGAGFMGAGIATIAVERGIRVRLSDPNRESVGRCLRHAHDYFAKKVERRRLKPFELSQKLAHLSPGVSPSGFNHTDVVIEAVFEDLKLKQKLLKQCEEIGGDHLIFASNTSALPITKIAEAAQNPDRVIGMHFFSPVEKMPLLEIVVTEKTAPWVTARVVELGQDLGKQVIIVRDGPGFYTTRALAFFLNEAAMMLEEGAPVEVIDSALTDFGFPVGPITLIDEVGIDVGIHVLETISAAFTDRMPMPKGLAPIADSGRLGRKNGKGFYIYENGKKTRPDSGVLELIGDRKGDSRLTAEEITDRCLLLFVNESVRCLEDGVLMSPADGDVGAVFGLGFPPFLGGPFKYCDHVGARSVVGQLELLAAKYGPRFEPAPTLRKYAETNQRFFPDEA